MKELLPILITICFGFLQTNAQTVFTENFNNYPVNTISNDITGATYGIGNWYTNNILQLGGGNNNGTTSDYKIVTEVLKGNVLQLGKFTNVDILYRNMYRNDLKTLFAQRNTNNKVLKISFDYFFGKKRAGINGLFNASVNFFVLRNKEENLLCLGFGPNNIINGYLPNKRKNTDIDGARGHGFIFRNANNTSKVLELPDDTWVTIEIYLDYTTSKVYFSLPAYNYTFVKDTFFKLELDGLEHDDTPFQFDIVKQLSAYGGLDDLVTKVDNINFSAQSTPPVVTLGINEVLNENFSVYPNPTNGIITISNTENIQMEKVLLYDVSGKEVFSSNSVINNQINIENFASGTYMLHLQTKEGTAVKKIIKQ